MSEDCWVSFDCFGTLIDWNGGFRKILSPLAGAQTEALLAAYHAHEAKLELEQPHRLYRDVLTTGLAMAARDIGVALEQADILVRQWDDLPLYPDVPAALETLRRDGCKIAVLTNCDDDLFARTLARNPQIAPDLVITAEQVGSYKPAFGHFRRFEQQTGVLRTNWLHAANSWVHDIAPARDLGITRVWVNRDRTGHDPAAATRVVSTVAELPEAVSQL